MKKGMLVVAIATLVVPSMAFGQGRSREDQRRRNLLLMEGVLVQAVRLGAQQVSAEMEKYEPTGVTALTGTPRARGFVLDGYGVFFDVEIPNLNQSIVWSMMTVQRDRVLGRDIDQLRSVLDTIPDAANRQRAQQLLQQVNKTVGPTTPERPVMTGQPPAPGHVSAASTAPLPDPDALYTEAVKSMLIDAMLDYSLQMNLSSEEWLTVAARASDGPLSPAGLSDSITIILRVKGGDLAAYHSDKTKRDEILQKVKADATVF